MRHPDDNFVYEAMGSMSMYASVLLFWPIHDFCDRPLNPN